MGTSRGDDTRNRIVNVAEGCFAAHGYDATGVAEICARAGVTKGGFYYHFDSKQALFLTLMTRWLDSLDDQLGAVSQEATSVPEALLEMAAVVEPAFRAAHSRRPLFLEFWRQASLDPVVWEAAVAPYRRYRSFFADMVRAGIAEGSLRAVEPQTVAANIVSLAVGLIMQGMMDPEGADWGHVARQSVEWLVRSLMAADPGRERDLNSGHVRLDST